MIRERRNYVVISLLFVFCFFTLTGSVLAQLNQEETFNQFRWRNIGPVNMKGRISDIEAVENNSKVVFVAAASGGVWKSVNGGTTWTSVFDKTGIASIGDIAIYQPDPEIVWVGTGEANNRNSVAWGKGIFKSTDGGKNWDCMGLESTHQIARVLTHPSNPDIVYAAAIGHLWGWSGDRGLFKTTDGGETWIKLTNGLPDDGKHGANDIVMDPGDPNTLIVNMYKRVRTAWDYQGGSEEGGLFKSTDGGNSWRKLTSGLPEGKFGRCGLDISRSDPNVVMAIVDSEQDEEWMKDNEWSTMRGNVNGNTDEPGPGVYRSEDGGETWEYVNTFQYRPLYFSQIRINPTDPQKVYIMGMPFKYSTDGGRTVKPGDNNFLGGAPKTHVDFHAMWIDPNDGDRWYLGSDGGAYLTQDGGKTYQSFHNMCISQFYAVGVDMREPYYVYGGLQDNGTWGGPSNSRDSMGILWGHWYAIGGGDGFHVQVDPTDYRTIYCESQAGNISRFDPETYRRSYIKPGEQNIINYRDFVPEGWKPAPGQRGFFRYNWSSPIIISPHNPHTVYFGGNHLFKTVDKGDSWRIISPDLSTDNPEKQKPSGGISPDNTGAETNGTIVTISESPLKPGLIWIGTDDGNVQITMDDGVNWENLTDNLPAVLPRELWVSRVEASHFEEGTAYISVDGHRSDEFRPYVFKTTDYGKTWTDISSNLPEDEPVYVIKEDLKNPKLLFLGTEFSAYASLDGGDSWTKINNNMPPVAVHDLVIHPRDNDLIAGTHGRGIWIMDNITPLQQLTEENLEKDVAVLENRVVTRWANLRKNISYSEDMGHQIFKGQNPQSIANIDIYLKESPSDTIRIYITDLSKEITRYIPFHRGKPGLNRVRWNFQGDPTELNKQVFQVLKNYFEEEDEDKKKDILENAIADLEPYFESDQDRRQTEQYFEYVKLGYITRAPRGPQRPFAGPDNYFIRVVVDGQEYTTTLEIRSDPLFEESR